MAYTLLDGIRVLDLTMVFAGPVCTKILAELGAEIIKIESVQRPDVFTRGNVYPENEPGVDPWNRGSHFHTLNAGKRGISLNLADERGRDLFKRLVRISDAVVENYSPRVMANWGLGYEELRKIRPDIVMVSLSGLGHYGPLKDFYMYVPGMEGMGGLTHHTGPPEGAPMLSGHAYGDWVAGATAASALMVALFHRSVTGEGQYVDVAGREAVACHAGDLIMEYTLNGKDRGRAGNRAAEAAPQGCYRCKGEDRWVTIAVEDEKQWVAFCRVIGHPEWIKDERFANVHSRLQNQDDLDALVEEWTAQRDHMEVTHILQAAGVAAGAVLDMKGVHLDQHLRNRGFFHIIEHGDGVGKRPIASQMPAKFDRAEAFVPKRAPRFGEDDEYVFGTLLKMSKAELEELAQEKIIGGSPVFPRGRPTRTDLIQQQRSGWLDPEYLSELRTAYGPDIGDAR